MDNLEIIDITLALLAVLSMLIALLAIKGHILELREGLSVSRERLLITTVCTSVLILLTILSFNFENKPKQAEAEPKTQQTQKQEPQKKISQKLRDSVNIELDQIRDSIKSIETEIKPETDEISRLQGRVAELEALIKTEKKNVDQEKDPVFQINPNKKIIYLIFGLFIFLLSLIALFIVGDFRSISLGKWSKLLKKKNKAIAEKEEKAIAKLNELAIYVQEEKYHEALKISEEIDANKLERLDVLDFYYLKNYSGVQILLQDLFRTDENIPPLKSDERIKLQKDTHNSLTILLDEAPRMAEAKYLLAVVKIMKQDYEEALKLFEEVEKKLKSKKVDFDNMKSYCLLHIAGEKLMKADSDGADEAFEQVLEIGVMNDKVPSVLIKNRLVKIMDSYQERDFVAVRENLRAIQTQDLEEERKKMVSVITEAVEILLLHTENRTDATFNSTGAFVKQHLPEHFPEPDDQAAEEYMFRNFNEEDLPISPQLFRVFFFLQALSLLQMKIKNRTSLTVAESEEIGYFLLRALQFDLRNREVLASLGVMYFWFNPSKRDKALEWMDAAINLGCANLYLYELVERYHNVEVNRQKLLAQFKDLSIKYFVNSNINKQLKEELALELGQFQEFKPVLMELDEMSHEEIKSPTIETLVNRSKHLKSLTLEIAKNKPFFKDINKVQTFYVEYGQLVTQLEVMANKAEDIEQSIMKEIGKVVLL